MRKALDRPAPSKSVKATTAARSEHSHGVAIRRPAASPGTDAGSGVTR
jgi:hypothetical protein